MDLSDPPTFAREFRRHERRVHAAALRILGDPARAQDVVQDVFLRLWRRPQAFDATRGELGAYLRLMARSRALDRPASGLQAEVVPAVPVGAGSGYDAAVTTA